MAEIPSQYSVYSFGEVNRHAKQMRILSISTSGELKRRITAIEYNQDVYSDTVTIQAPVLVSDLTLGNIYATDYIRESAGGAIETVVSLSWRGSYMSYAVSYVENIEGAIPISVPNVRTSSVDIAGLKDGSSYTFTVNGKSIVYVVQGKTTAPDIVTNLTGYESAGNYLLAWDYVYKALDFSHFEITLDGITLGATIDTKYQYFSGSPKLKSFGVIAVDMTGNKSIPVTLSLSYTLLPDITGLKSYYQNEISIITWDKVTDNRTPIDYEIRMGTLWENGNILGRTLVNDFSIPANGDYMIKAHYRYQDGTDIYSANEVQISIIGAVLPKNIVATFDEKSTGWIGNKTNVFINSDGNLELSSFNIDDAPIIDDIPEFNYYGGIQTIGSYEIPSAHIVDIGTAQSCRIWVDYNVYSVVVTNRVDSYLDFDSTTNIDGYSSEYALIPQISIAQNDGIFGAWQDFVVGEYVGRKFKFRGIFYSYDQYTTVILSKATFTVDMPDKLQSGNGISVGTSGVSVTYPIAFQVAPNVQITIVNAQDGDDAILTNETATGFDIQIKNGGVAVTRTINWLAKGY